MIDPGNDRVNPIVRFAVHRRVTMAMAVLGVLVLGWFSLTRLPLEFLPSFSSSFVTVRAPYASSSPQETERLIVRPLEDSLGTINGIDTLTATATSSSGSVRVGFVDGTDMDLAAVDVRDRVDRVRNLLPEDLERIEIRRFQTSDRPILRFNVSAPWQSDQLYRFVEDVLVRRLQRLEGVADVDVRGDREREVQVNLIPDRLAAHGVDVRDVANVLRLNHLSLSAGVIREGSKVFQVRVEGKILDLEEIRALPLGRGTLRVGDVAEILFAFPEQEDFSFLNGSEAMSVYIYKSSTANLLSVIDGVHDELAAIRALPEAEGLDINVYRDDSEDVRNGLAELRNTGLLGGGLAVLFMYLFLRRVRTTLLIAIAIPVSVVVTFVIMYLSRQAGWTDLTLNIMSLMGLMLAVGMLVDNSIVVIESIFRHRQEMNEDARTATLVGASEVVMPIIASTLTTMCVFLPMVFLPAGGRFSRFMSSIGLTVVIVMAASLLVAITVVPMVAARLLKREKPRPHLLFDRMTATYGRSLQFMLRHRLAFTVAVIVTLIWSWNLYQGIGRSFSPPSFERQIAIEVDVPSSYSVDQKRALYDEVYALIDDHRDELEIADVTHSFRRSSGRSRGWGSGNRFDIYLVDEEQSRIDTGAIRDRVEALLPVKPGVKFTIVAVATRPLRFGGRGSKNVCVGERVEILEALSERLVAVLAGVDGLKDADSSLESGTRRDPHPAGPLAHAAGRLVLSGGWAERSLGLVHPARGLSRGG